MNPRDFVIQLAQVSLPNVFNPYRDLCCEHDHAESAKIRRLNLERYLTAAVGIGVDSIWLGRDCGYRGARRTGIALTDEVQLPTVARYFRIAELAKATAGDSVKERTATEVWNVISRIRARVFLWNIFPLHPFEGENPMTNRRHSTREFSQCRDVLVSLLNWLKPKRIIALGVDAHKTLQRLEFKAIPVRHPSYGGHLEFAAAIDRIYAHGD